MCPPTFLLALKPVYFPSGLGNLLRMQLTNKMKEFFIHSKYSQITRVGTTFLEKIHELRIKVCQSIFLYIWFLLLELCDVSILRKISVNRKARNTYAVRQHSPVPSCLRHFCPTVNMVVQQPVGCIPNTDQNS
jgi:hypothetical protein